MKKSITMFILLSVFNFFSSPVLAFDAEGVVQEIKHCRTGTAWRVLLFKVDGSWFGMYSDNYAHTHNGVNDFLGSSIVMQAFAANYTVKLRASGGWNSTFSGCGEAAGAVIGRARGDYIHVVK